MNGEIEDCVEAGRESNLIVFHLPQHHAVVMPG